MPRKMPPFVESWHDRHGKLRIYFRRGKGTRIALPDKIGSLEFIAAYQAALAGEVEASHRRSAVPPCSFGALIDSYMRSPAYVDLRATTKTGYRSRIETLRKGHAHRPVAGLNRERIYKAFIQPYAGRPGAALAVLKMLRVLIRHAIEIGLATARSVERYQASQDEGN